MFCFHVRHTQLWLYRRMWFFPIPVQHCSSWARQRCFCSSLAFTMPGTLSCITFLSDQGRRNNMRADNQGPELKGGKKILAWISTEQKSPK